jgi:hypothetical protein
VLRDANSPPPPPNEWFVEDIIADGDHVTVRVNGKLTAEYDEPNHVPRGRIALQMLDDRTVVDFESVEVKRLPNSPAPAVSALPSGSPPKPAVRQPPAKNPKKKSKK